MTLKLELKDLPLRSKQLSVSEIDQMLGGGSTGKGGNCSITANCKTGLSCCPDDQSKIECITYGILSLGITNIVQNIHKNCMQEFLGWAIGETVGTLVMQSIAYCPPESPARSHRTLRLL